MLFCCHCYITTDWWLFSLFCSEGALLRVSLSLSLVPDWPSPSLLSHCLLPLPFSLYSFLSRILTWGGGWLSLVSCELGIELFLLSYYLPHISRLCLDSDFCLIIFVMKDKNWLWLLLSRWMKVFSLLSGLCRITDIAPRGGLSRQLAQAGSLGSL